MEIGNLANMNNVNNSDIIQTLLCFVRITPGAYVSIYQSEDGAWSYTASTVGNATDTGDTQKDTSIKPDTTKNIITEDK